MRSERNWSMAILVLNIVAAIALVAVFAAGGSAPEPVLGVVRWARVMYP